MLLLATILLLAAPCYPQSWTDPLPPLPSVDPALRARYPLALEAILGIGIRLQTFQEPDSENFLVSPLGAAALLGELALGATGDLHQKLISLLSLPSNREYQNTNIVYQYAGGKRNITHHLPYSRLHIEMKNLLKALKEGQTRSYILNEESALFYDRDLQLSQDFERALKTLYSAQIFPLNFGSDPVNTQRFVNEWASKNTNGLISTILASPPPPTTRSILANAIYFKAEWETPFSDALNREGDFTVSPTKTVPVTYMLNSFEQLPYAESSTYRIIGLPYQNQELSFYIILPNKDNPFIYNMKSFVKSIKSSEVLDTLLKMKRGRVVIKLPKMRLSNSFSLLKQLKKYQNFQKTRDTSQGKDSVSQLEESVHKFENTSIETGGDFLLDGATTGPALRIDNIIQQVVITVNEKGTEAAAIAAATIDYMGGSKNFLVDRPFLFFINHVATGVTLFWGSVTNPAS